MSRITRSAVMRAIGDPLTIETLEAPDPAFGQVLVRMMASGVCHSDETIRIGNRLKPLPIVLGHEGAGIIEAVGEGVHGLAVGDKVIGNAAPNCGRCLNCMTDLPVMCERTPEIVGRNIFSGQGATIGTFAGLGTFSEMTTVDQRSVIRVESDLPFEQLALFGCAVQTGLGATLNAAAIKPGATVAIVGCGGIGQVMIQGARIAGAGQIIAVDPSPHKLALAKKHGADQSVDSSQGDAVEQVRALTRGRGVDIAFEAVGLGKTMYEAWAMARIGGTIVPVGVGGQDMLSIAPSDFVMSAKIWRPSLYSEGLPEYELPRFLRFAESGLLNMADMVSQRLPLESINEALTDLGRPEVVRTVIALS